MRLPVRLAISATSVLGSTGAVLGQEIVHALPPGPGVEEIVPAGDVDADGVGDLLWGNALTFFGSDTRVVSGATGRVIHDVDGPGYHGASVGAGGDLDADGHDDILVSDPLGLGVTPRAYSGADGSELFRFPSTNTRAGTGLAIVPDVDGDGHDDIVLGNPSEQTPNGLGLVRVRSGRDGSELLSIPADPGHGNFGHEVAPAGDVDGDGVEELIIGVTSRHAIRVVSLADGRDVLRLPNPSPAVVLGSQVGTVGDADGDGVPDPFVGGPERNGWRSEPGRVAVFRGADGSELWTARGDAVGDRFGAAVDAVGDLDGDGVFELAVAAPQRLFATEPGPGYVRVLSGATGAELVTLTPAALGEAKIGLRLASAGDANGDGNPELAVRAASGVLVVSLANLALSPDRRTVSVAAGGSQGLTLDAGPAHAGKPYVLAGSASGIAPGLVFGGMRVPLNLDPYLVASVAGAGAPPLLGTAGILDARGTASASITLPAGSPSSFAGTLLHHAFAVLDPATARPELTSNAAVLELVP